jgi:hypothetical protein
MNLKSRLSKLEKTRRAANGLDPKLVRTLVTVVARRDALFYPWRNLGNHRVAVLQRQRAYLAGSGGIATKADGKHEWKDAQAIRQSLIANGLVSAIHSGGQVQSVFVTARGDALACQVVARLNSLRSVIHLFEGLKELAPQYPPGVPESALFGVELTGRPSQWEILTEAMLPILCAGLATSNSDVPGRVYYRPTGLEVPSMLEADETANRSDEQEETYIRAFNDERTTLEASIPDDPTEILIPMRPAQR